MIDAVDIQRAAAAWVWCPRDSEQWRGQLQLVRYPSRFGGGVTASQAESGRDARAVVDEAVERTRHWGERRIRFWVSAADVPDLEAELQARGAVHDDTVSILARPLDGDTVAVPLDVTAEVVRAREQVIDMDSVNVPVWQQAPLDDVGIDVELAEITDALQKGEGARVIARIDGRPVSTGGFTVVQQFARLWGAATTPEARGRGAYRAVLAERMRRAAEMGATMALVKGRIATSAPILERAGFQRFGEERVYVLTLP